MVNKNIRTKYIKSLMEDKSNLSKVLEESTKDSLNNLLDDKVYQNLRRVLSESEEIESEDSYEVEEVKPEEPIIDNETEEVETSDEEVETPECENDDENCDSEGCEVWDEVEDCKDADGEYDLREKDINTVLKVIQSMDPEDGVRIIKNDDNTATVQPENGEEEFEINIEVDEEPEANEFENNIEDELKSSEEDSLDLNGGDENTIEIDVDGISDLTNDENEDENSDIEFELELDDNEENEEDAMNENHVNLGYTDNYQNKTAMTLPSDKGEGEGDSRFDDGAPKGGQNNKKRWVGSNGKNGGNPYSENINENDDCLYEFEVEMGDEMPVEEAHNVHALGREHNSVADQRSVDSETPNDEFYRNVKHGSKARGTARQNFNESKELANLKRKAAAILQENKELKEIASQIKTKLMEAAVVNSSLSKIIRLITENSTTRDEKLSIVNRFNNVKSLNESRALYSQISEELKNAHVINNSSKLLNNQLTETKSQNNNMIVETKMLQQSDGIKAVQDFQERMNKLGKK